MIIIPFANLHSVWKRRVVRTSRTLINKFPFAWSIVCARETARASLRMGVLSRGGGSECLIPGEKPVRRQEAAAGGRQRAVQEQRGKPAPRLRERRGDARLPRTCCLASLRTLEARGAE